MMRTLCIFSLFFLSMICRGQELPAEIQQQIELLAEQQESDPEDDALIEELQRYRREPLSLNSAGASELELFRFLTPIQINSFVRYREMLGPLSDIYELQAVPGWDIATIRKILPYITVTDPASISKDLRAMRSGGEHQVLIRTSSQLEKPSAAHDGKYSGNLLRIFFRYRYQYKRKLQWGITGDKDAGEGFFKGGQKQGFDFYSMHLFMRDAGIVRALALGDYTVNLGQGLIHWQGMAFGMGSDLVGVKRQSPVLKPYTSSGEFNFLRGAALTLQKNKWNATVLISKRKPDANISEGSITSFITSGYHRTENERADRGAADAITAGGNLSLRNKKFNIGINAMHYRFSLPVLKKDEAYNLFAMKGRSLSLASVDYGFTNGNIHLFGEFAINGSRGLAAVQGLLASLHPDVDLSIHLRWLQPTFHSLFGNAFTTATLPSNEKGVYAALKFRLSGSVIIDLYGDLVKFPWLRFRVDAPSNGTLCGLQLQYTVSKRSSILIRLRYRENIMNGDPEITRPIEKNSALNLRLHLEQALNGSLRFRGRVEANRFQSGKSFAENGFLIYCDLLYKPLGRPFSFTMRASAFETDSYNARVYAYENHVLYGYSIPPLSGRGFRYYINTEYDPGRNITIWARWAQTIYRGLASVGSGEGETLGNKRSEWTLQLRVLF